MLEPSILLGAGGPLARHIENFAPRVEQQEFSEAVAATLRDQGLLVAEAGTGVGKTFAYLIPALASGAKVIISTGTKTLQDQLFSRDIPLVRRALALPVSVALLKGRANYLCHYRLDQAQQHGELGPPAARRMFAEIGDWAQRTRTGDIEEVADLAANGAVSAMVTSTGDNCLGQDCPALSRCFVANARRKAQEADVTIINHHLLFSDFLLREGGFGELLPDADAYIVDEAHRLLDLAAGFFGVRVSSRQIVALLAGIEQELKAVASDATALCALTDELLHTTELLSRLVARHKQRGPWQTLDEDSRFRDLIRGLGDKLATLATALEALACQSRGLDNCWRRSVELLQTLKAFAASEQIPDRVNWYERGSRSFVFHQTPMLFSQEFRRCIDQTEASWVFTSATLSVGESFGYFTEQLGIADARTAKWPSPFDYRRHSLLFAPSGMPEPGDRDYTAAVVDAALPVLAASGGRAFMLFTSHAALSEAEVLLRDALRGHALLVQGQLPRTELLQAFRASGRAILLGTASFWEGVDVRGPALSVVIIDKLPFASPDDPLLQARADLLRSQGKNPFREYQLPQAVVALNQGVGRLIRDVSDRGVVVLCDPRLFTRSYGKTFVKNLPAMPITRDIADVRRFFSDVSDAVTA